MNNREEIDRILAQERATPRDVAILMEITQQELDRLDGLLKKDLFKMPETIVSIGGKTVKFENEDKLFSFLAGVMNGR